MSLVLNVPEFWVYQSSGFEHARILKIPKFWICQGDTGFRICLNNSSICLNMPDYDWICLNMLEIAGICVNMPKSAWMAFVLHFSIPHLFYNLFSSGISGYLFERLKETKGYKLKENEAVFLKRQNLTFYIAAGSISFVFCFRLSIFTRKT